MLHNCSHLHLPWRSSKWRHSAISVQQRLNPKIKDQPFRPQLRPMLVNWRKGIIPSVLKGVWWYPLNSYCRHLPIENGSVSLTKDEYIPHMCTHTQPQTYLPASMLLVHARHSLLRKSKSEFRKDHMFCSTWPCTPWCRITRDARGLIYQIPWPEG